MKPSHGTTKTRCTHLKTRLSFIIAKAQIYQLAKNNTEYVVNVSELVWPENTSHRGNITEQLGCCLTGLDLSKQVNCCSFNISKAAESKQNKQEVSRTMILSLN